MSSPAVVAADTASVREVGRLMLEHGVGGVPVIDASGAAIGMASDGDLMGRRSGAGRSNWWLRMLADGAPRTTCSVPAAAAPSAKSCRRP